ncbi:esterase/lipase family protein [Actinomadura oligospora]|uniref:esterase/lipase family protein n=1 Tax=Actinomadura oligospora TaxID=111804 RepID=UPI0004B050FC|nr:alpha/beta fold hydrolase [Actinomadura oligospora]
MWWLAGLSPRRRWYVGGMSALVAVIVLVVAGRFALARAGRDAGPAADQSTPGPVVLVPGYGGGTDGLAVLARRFERLGRRAVIVLPPGNGTGDLRKQADSLDRRVNALLRGGAPSVDVVGYSAGGVVTRLWARDHNGAHKARRIVTLGSPHQGADVSAAGAALSPGACPTACQQLVPDSPLLRGLGDRVGDSPEWMSVWTTRDQVVTPPESARLDGAINVVLQEICPDVRTGHDALPSDPLVGGLVLRALGSDLMTTPAPSDCASLRADGS